MNQFRSPFANTPPVVKNLVIINVIVFLATWVFETRGMVSLTRILGLHYFESEYFLPHQFVTHMFMHGGITHLFFNMFALWMFGRVLENVWGPRRFLTYFFITGLGAAALHTFVNYLEIHPMVKAFEAFNNNPGQELFAQFVDRFQSEMKSVGMNLPYILEYANEWLDKPAAIGAADDAVEIMDVFVTKVRNIPTVGASGAVFGVLLAFGMLFPNTRLMLLFPPIPIKAKYFVIGYGLIELYLGLSGSASNVAHFAHLGGMIFGFFLIKYWNKHSKNFF